MIQDTEARDAGIVTAEGLTAVFEDPASLLAAYDRIFFYHAKKEKDSKFPGFWKIIFFMIVSISIQRSIGHL